MILDPQQKPPLPEDSTTTPIDAPPSYEDTFQTISPSAVRLAEPKQSPAAPNSASLRSPIRSPTSIAGPSSPSVYKHCGPAIKASWLQWGRSRTEKDVRATVLGLVRDLVREHHSDSSAPAGILQSCAAACEGRSLSLSSILQEKSIENHTPLYWAIVKRRPDEHVDDQAQIPDLLIALLSHSTPLTKETILDIRQACLITSDQALFQRLRMSPEFATVSGKDQMLLGVTLPHDEIEVEELGGEEGQFAVDFVIPHFQKRMMVTQEIILEFIARSRMWKLTFAIAGHSTNASGPWSFPAPPAPNAPKTGSWTISLGLQDNSPPTWVDSRLVIPEPIVSRDPPPGPASPAVVTPPTDTPSFFQSFGLQPKSASKGRPPIAIRLPCRDRLQVGSQIVVCLEDDPHAATLQYAGTPYIAADEKLRGRLEARLKMPETDCVIC
ncbi:hypothetical protein NMY22_g11556 [Coprinellus aureogranulatus]|nr:hypothetical protein NMY22_g11556 [Coprinellus aureogranulatus]